jgi:hypothetical protein
MMSHSPAAFGLYPSTRALYFGADALRAARFRQTDISVMYSDGFQALQLRESDEETGVADGEPESLGEMLSALSGIGAVVLHNDGSFIAGGPILAKLTSAGQGLLSSLRELGIPEGAVQHFEGRLRQGGLLLWVQCEDRDWADRAQRILHETGAETVAATM